MNNKKICIIISSILIFIIIICVSLYLYSKNSQKLESSKSLESEEIQNEIIENTTDVEIPEVQEEKSISNEDENQKEINTSIVQEEKEDSKNVAEANSKTSSKKTNTKSIESKAKNTQTETKKTETPKQVENTTTTTTIIETPKKEEIKEAIAEAPGDSYTAYERVSVITGISTPAGWKVHEWLWRDSLNGIEKRTKDIDGFFVDNIDIYYQYPRPEIYNGLCNILNNLMDYDKPVIVNGGDVFVSEYISRNGNIKDILTGINQETVFSKINFDQETFEKNDEDTIEYFKKYIEECKSNGLDVYITEYTTDKKLIRQIKDYCKENGFHYYISDSIQLD